MLSQLAGEVRRRYILVYVEYYSKIGRKNYEEENHQSKWRKMEKKKKNKEETDLQEDTMMKSLNIEI